MVKGTLHQRYLRDKQKAVQAVPYDDVASALAALKAGQITGVMGDFATLDAWQQENPDYAIMDERATDPAYYGSACDCGAQRRSGAAERHQRCPGRGHGDT